MKNYRWYWRLEPGVQFTCAITYDPFVEMARHGKSYGYTIALWEVPETCPSLFRAVEDYKEEKEIPTTPNWKAMIESSWAPWPVRRLLGWLDKDNRNQAGDSWNLCHYWSNFEVADLDFFRSKEYRDFFEHLDQAGGFYNERVSNDAASCGDDFIVRNRAWTDTIHSGVMHPSTPSPSIFSSHQRNFTTFPTLAITTNPSSNAPTMPREDSCRS